MTFKAWTPSFGPGLLCAQAPGAPALGPGPLVVPMSQPALRGRSAWQVWSDMGLTEDIKIDLSSLMKKVKRLSYSIPPEEAEQIEAAITLANPEAGFANQQVRVVDFHLWSLGVSNAPSAGRDEVQRVRRVQAAKRTQAFAGTMLWPTGPNEDGGT